MDRSGSTGPGRGSKGREAFRTISEVADQLDLPQHVLRFWESKFSQIKPLKRGGNRRYYRPDDVTLLTAIKKLLHSDGYTIRGVQKLFKAQGVKATVVQALEDSVSPQLVAAAEAEVEAEEAPINSPENDGEAVKSFAGSGDKEAALQSVLDRLKALRAALN